VAATRPETLDIVHGLRAGLAVFAARPKDIVRAAFAREVRAEVEPLVRWAAQAGVVCEELPPPELERIADSSHHEGLVVAARPRRFTKAAELSELLVKNKGRAIALDRVRNPYNVGAVLRTAAFFGVDAVLLAQDLAPMAVRVAEGGVERLAISRTTDLADTLARLRTRGIKVLGADGASDLDARTYDFERPSVLVVGHEREGMSTRVRAECDAILAIRGTGSVESLNVAVATGILISRM
jgi:TrmH RNA methyltransferase